MKLFKIGLFLTILLLTLSMVSAFETSDYTIPSKFNGTAGAYTFKTADFEFGIIEYNDDNGEFDFYFNDSENYTIEKNDTMGNYTDASADEVGSIEMVEINGEKYIVECCYTKIDNSKFKDCSECLLEFNKQNNLKPLTIE